MKQIVSIFIVTLFISINISAKEMKTPPKHSMSHGKSSMHSCKNVHNNQGMKKMGGGSYAKMVLLHATLLNLSEIQIGKIYKLKDSWKAKRMDLKMKAMDSMKEFHMQMKSPIATDDEIRKATKAHTNFMMEMTEVFLQERKEVNAILNKEQLEKLKHL